MHTLLNSLVLSSEGKFPFSTQQFRQQNNWPRLMFTCRKRFERHRWSWCSTENPSPMFFRIRKLLPRNHETSRRLRSRVSGDRLVGFRSKTGRTELWEARCRSRSSAESNEYFDKMFRTGIRTLSFAKKDLASALRRSSLNMILLSEETS